ncbi:MAG: cobalamin-binding protein [Oscillibacter sp.]|nr:cobalamin-binding protein [Oscillibacter sp.]
MSVLQELSLNVEKGKRKLVPGLVQQALDEGLDPNVILNEGMIDAMSRVGDAFREGKIFVPEMLIAAKAMQAGVATLKPALAAGGAVSRGKLILGTVAGDLHDIGKNLVGMMLESAGFEVIDLGVDVADEAFLDAYNANPDVKLICLSALLTTTMPAMRSAVAKINAAPWRDKVKVMVGGAPITQAFCDEIGADCYTPDAASAAEAAKKLVE